MSQWNDKPNDWPWPDPIHRVYQTLMSQRVVVDLSGRYDYSRRELRALARQLAAKKDD